jgi:hypothetical protein
MSVIVSEGKDSGENIPFNNLLCEDKPHRMRGEAAETIPQELLRGLATAIEGTPKKCIFARSKLIDLLHQNPAGYKNVEPVYIQVDVDNIGSNIIINGFYLGHLLPRVQLNWLSISLLPVNYCPE